MTARKMELHSSEEEFPVATAVLQSLMDGNGLRRTRLRAITIPSSVVCSHM